MSKRETIARYHHIIHKLRIHPSTFDEVSDYLELQSEIYGDKYTISKRTFQRDLDDIEKIYNIVINYDYSKKVYVVEYDKLDKAFERIIEAFDTYNALNISDKLSNHIHFETRKPQGTENLNGILKAIKNKLQIKFTYQKFGEEHGENRQVEPYALKESKNRWYVLAKDLKDNKIKTFALDRLRYLDIQKKNFKIPADFDVNEYFKYSFGIISPDGQKAEEVILSFTPVQGKYIKTLPLHDSQEILVDNEKEVRISLRIFLTHDFKMELLSLGENVQVVQPQSLINELKNTFTKALKLYK
ncbi:MAG TPA: WYL domain-containing protein [Chitinophagales bacterium]|nr:WYL domain-containing protein [Chitinophagales bacterium]